MQDNDNAANLKATLADRGKIARVTQIPNCDLCTNPTPAVYDAATNVGPWAFMCEYHFEHLGVGLGTGRGQRLVLG